MKSQQEASRPHQMEVSFETGKLGARRKLSQEINSIDFKIFRAEGRTRQNKQM